MSKNTEQIWQAFSNKLLKFIETKVGNKEDAEDILQSVFIKIHENKNKLAEVDNIEGWLYRVTRNAIIDYYRKDKKTESLPDNFEELFPEIAEDTESQYYPILSNCFEPMINTLPDKYKKPLIMADIEGLKQDEIAKKLDISLSGAKSRIQRARKMLRQKYFDCCNFKFDKQGHLTGFSKGDNCDDTCTPC